MSVSWEKYRKKMRVILECKEDASEALSIARRIWELMRMILKELEAMNG